jgi:hypothetical protein
MTGLRSLHGYAPLPRELYSIAANRRRQVFFVFFCGFAITGVVHGTGQHADRLPPAEIPVGLKVRDPKSTHEFRLERV